MKIMYAINLFVKDKGSHKFLAVKRSDKDSLFPGMLALPGGEINKGEEIKEAGSREFFEETGIRLKSIEDKPSIVSRVNMGSFILKILVYKAILDNPNVLFAPHDEDITEVIWVHPNDFIDSIKEHGYPEDQSEAFKRFLISENLLTV